MVVPARPTDLAPIDTVWGQVAHDAIVAQDVQVGSGQASFAAANQAPATITFPRAFASPPTVMVTVGPHNAGAQVLIFAQLTSITATQVVVRLVSSPGTNITSSNVPFQWVAYGPRA